MIFLIIFQTKNDKENISSNVKIFDGLTKINKFFQNYIAHVVWKMSKID